MSDAAVSSRVRGALGLGSLAVGAVVLVGALAGPASAHESKVEPKPKPGGSSCPELAEEAGVDQQWQQFTLDDVADGDFTETYPIDGYDDETVTITVKQGKTFVWDSTLGIDAIYVQGRDTEMANNSYFYLYAPEADSAEAYGDEDLGTPPWQEWGTNKIKSITFCYDDEQPPPSSSTSSSSTTETPPSTQPEPTTSSSIDLNTSSSLPGPTTTAGIDLSADTTLPPTTAVVETNQLPKTGSNSTGLLIALGAVLVLGGGALLATTRLARHRGE